MGDVHPIGTPPKHAPSNGGNNGNGREIHGRLTALETRMEYLATKEDIAGLKTHISDKQSSTLKWQVGILITVIIALCIAVVRTFFN
ncbi:MAG: hypothetical protein OXC91_13115 [Rhodobacteraceae bacterium]|nr:hypothetical protein [Paracoccaceae bacterium]